MKESSAYSASVTAGNTFSDAAIEKLVSIAIASAAAILCKVIDMILENYPEP